MAEIVQVAWKTIPVSEPVLPGEFSAKLRRERGQPVNWAFLIATVAPVSTTRARELLRDGTATLNGEAIAGEFGYVKPDDVLRIGTGVDYIIGPAP